MFSRATNILKNYSQYYWNIRTKKWYKVMLFTSYTHNILDTLFMRMQYSSFINNTSIYSSIRIKQPPLSTHNIIKFVDITRSYFPIIDKNMITSEFTIVFPNKTIRYIEYITKNTSTFTQIIEQI